VSLRTWFQTTIHVSALCLLQPAAIAQQEPITANQVISRYMEAIGANRFSSITTLIESGELYGNVTNFWRSYRSPWQSQNKEHARFDSYFKSPNLRFSSTVTETNQVIAVHGCDGKMGWYIDSSLRRTEFKTKPGSESDCEEGLQAPQSRLRQPNTKMRLVKKKGVEGRMAWEIKVDVPTSSATETYYFDAETFLLIRFEKLGTTVTYSDYRDLGGIKLPFAIVQEFTNSKLVTTVREVRINAPIDDARFAQPHVKGGKIELNASVTPKKDGAEAAGVDSASALATNAGSSNLASVKSADAHNADSVVEVNYPNFTSCSIEDLQLAVPELKGLKPSADQGKLSSLLEKIGAKTLDVAQNTPNLISRESVTDLPGGAGETRRDYDYLILARIKGEMVGLDEFRLDLKTGDKFQTDEVMNNKSSFRNHLERASKEIAMSKRGRPPLSQGFATSWLHFYPSNRAQATYRYLGEQKRDGHGTLVLAFAEKPESVLIPAMFRSQDKTAPMFLQGIAWVDPSDFRIVRLRTDLLSPVPEVSLHRLTADIQFKLTRIEHVPSPLPLPRQVTVISTVGTSTMHEIHEYSEYRLFRAQSRVVLSP
jgi:hypothetical protein